MPGKWSQKNCEVCNKTTWFYTDEFGRSKCTTHSSSIQAATGTVQEKQEFIRKEENESKFVPFSHDTVRKEKKEEKVYQLDQCPKGFHLVMCVECNKVTTHYKGEGDREIAHCTICNHEKMKLETRTIVPVDLRKIPPTEGELRRMNRLDMNMFSKSVEKRAHLYAEGDLNWVRGLLPKQDAVTNTPGSKHCSFCQRETPNIQILSEKQPKIMRDTESYIDNITGLVNTKEIIRVQVKTVYACPDCSLRILKPEVTRRV